MQNYETINNFFLFFQQSPGSGYVKAQGQYASVDSVIINHDGIWIKGAKRGKNCKTTGKVDLGDVKWMTIDN
jgi:hypothetical protein